MIFNSGQSEEHDARGALIRNGTRDFERQSSLSDTAGAYQRDEPNGPIAEPAVQGLHVFVATDERRQRSGESAATQFVNRRVLDRRSGTAKQRIAGGTSQIKRRR